MAVRRLSVRKPLKLSPSLARNVARRKGRNLLNAAVPIAMRAVGGVQFFNTWVSLKLGLFRRGRRK